METTIMGYIGYILSYIGLMEKEMETTIVYWGNVATERSDNLELTLIAPCVFFAQVSCECNKSRV